ncbi:MAG: intradiol ring-cleavage dioxygenase [Chloroflexota bacterium]|nr:intradiol ring-cleavage dioxygenase [Chloroflexota bacterium]
MGRILSRREVLSLIGATGAALLVGCGAADTGSTRASGAAGSAGASLNAEAQTAVALASDPATQATQAAEVATAEAANTAVATPACVVRPEVTEGPYYVDVDLVRSDIREQKAGAPLVLTFNVLQVADRSCTPLEGATVEIWHCDAEGAYSGVSDPGFDTSGQTWLRGAQVTDAHGVATFTTIYPGWYSGRAVHIHFKVSPSADKVFTSQLFFDDALSQQVFAQAPYAAKGSTQDTLNSTDNIYQDLLLLDTTQSSDGYAATFPIGIDLTTVGSGQNTGGPGGPPPRP